MDLSELQRFGTRMCVIAEDRRFNYQELRQSVREAGECFRKAGGRPGDVVVLAGRYDFSTVAWLLALAEEKCVVVPLGTDGIADRLGGLGVGWVVRPGEEGVLKRWGGEGDSVELFQVLRDKGRAGLVLFSSGTTGRPKGMVHDFDRLLGAYRVGEAKDLRVLAFMGIDHIGGLDILFRGLAAGTCLVIPGERSPEEICRLIERERVNVLPATPSFLNLLLLSEAWRGRDLSSLEIIGFGAERMPAGVLRRLREVFPNVRFQQKFGTSETNAVRTENREDDPLWIRIADPEVEWRIVDGELWLKTPSRILGYIGFESDRLLSDGWYRTGDFVEEGEDGFFRVIGRRETVINVGGEKVLPGEVEETIRELPEVADCRVFGVANAILGQVVNAEVLPGPGVDGAELVRTVRRHCRERLAGYKVPVKVRAVAGFGVNERGKRGI